MTINQVIKILLHHKKELEVEEWNFRRIHREDVSHRKTDRFKLNIAIDVACRVMKNRTSTRSNITASEVLDRYNKSSLGFSCDVLESLQIAVNTIGELDNEDIELIDTYLSKCTPEIKEPSIEVNGFDLYEPIDFIKGQGSSVKYWVDMVYEKYPNIVLYDTVTRISDGLEIKVGQFIKLANGTKSKIIAFTERIMPVSIDLSKQLLLKGYKKNIICAILSQGYMSFTLLIWQDLDCYAWMDLNNPRRPVNSEYILKPNHLIDTSLPQ